MALAVITLIIIAVSMVSFVLEKIPLAVTAVGAAVLMALVGAISLEDAYSAFGSTTTIFCGAMMVVGSALFRTGFSDLVASWLNRANVDKNETVFVGVVTLVSAVLSAFLSNVAVVMIFIPLIAIVAARSAGKIRVPLAVFASGVGAAVGGAATLTGSTAQLVTQGIFEATPGITPMGVFTLSALGVPLIIVTVVYMSTVGVWLGRRVLTFDAPELVDSSASGDADKPAPTWKLWFAIAVLLAIVAGFVSGVWNIAIVALLGALIMIVSGCISFKDAVSRVDWNTLIILSAAQAFGLGLTESGAGDLISDGVVAIAGEDASPLLVLGVFVFVCAILTNFTSNTALTAMFVPIVMSVANVMDASPVSWAITVTMACSLSTGSPVGTPAMTATLVAGLRYLDYIKLGGPLVLLLAAVTAVVGPIVYS